MFSKVKIFVLTVLLALFSFTFITNTANASSTLDQSNPKNVVTIAIDNTLSILSKYKGHTTTANESLRTEVYNNVLPYFNTRYISGIMLGPYYRQATVEQRKEFQRVVTNYMVNAYIEGLSFYNGQNVKINNPQYVGSYFATDVVTVYDSQPIHVNFKLLKGHDGNYKIVDFVAEGISFADTKAQEWRQIIKNKGVDGLINYIKAHSKNILNNLHLNK